jgi:hypothetical protein
MSEAQKIERVRALLEKLEQLIKECRQSLKGESP